MRNQWRLLLRCNSRRQLHSFREPPLSLLQVQSPPPPTSPSPRPLFPRPNSFRFFSTSELALEQNKDSDYIATLTDLFSTSSKTHGEVKNELASSDIMITDDFVFSALKSLSHNRDVCKRFFNWVFEVENEKLRGNSYNLMLSVLGGNGESERFLDLVRVMKKKGYGVLKSTIVTVSEKFDVGEMRKLNDLLPKGFVDISVDEACSGVSKTILGAPWGDGVEEELRQREFSSDLVVMVVEKLGIVDPNKALIFFRWIEESGLFKHVDKSYNALARALAREDYVDKFWKVIDEMRAAQYYMDRGTFVKALNQFSRKKMVSDAVDLFEFSMSGPERPVVEDSAFLLNKIVTAKELDMNLFSKVVKVVKEGGQTLTTATRDTVLKSLTSVGRYGECNKILKAMDDGGYAPSENLKSETSCHDGNDAEAMNEGGYSPSENLKSETACHDGNDAEETECALNYKTWASLVEGHCEAGHLDEASDCFLEMIEKEGTSSAGYPLHMLVNAYCLKRSAVEAHGIFTDLITAKELKPWHITFKELITKLLVQGGFKEALDLLGFMKTHRFTPFLDPFFEYLSKSGSADDTVLFLKAITGKRYPSLSVCIRVFEACSKAGRLSEAQDFLSECPRYVRNNPDVLNIFHSMNSAAGAAVHTALAS